MHSLGGIDLNLMVALHALLEETNVTAAARRAGVSQPAMSRSLARLRLHFGDPLLIRAGRRMVPTARAVALVDEVRQAVQSLERLWANNDIEPSQLRADIRLVTDDHVGTTLLPSAVAHSPEAWAAASHVIVSPTGGRRGVVDTALQAHGLERRVAIVVPHFHTALAIVAETNHVLTVPQSLVQSGWRGLAQHSPPLSLPPNCVAMLWHLRTQHDPVQQWLRGVIAEVASRTFDRLTC